MRAPPRPQNLTRIRDALVCLVFKVRRDNRQRPASPDLAHFSFPYQKRPHHRKSKCTDYSVRFSDHRAVAFISPTNVNSCFQSERYLIPRSAEAKVSFPHRSSMAVDQLQRRRQPKTPKCYIYTPHLRVEGRNSLLSRSWSSRGADDSRGRAFSVEVVRSCCSFTSALLDSVRTSSEGGRARP